MAFEFTDPPEDQLGLQVGSVMLVEGGVSTAYNDFVNMAPYSKFYQSEPILSYTIHNQNSAEFSNLNSAFSTVGGVSIVNNDSYDLSFKMSYTGYLNSTYWVGLYGGEFELQVSQFSPHKMIINYRGITDEVEGGSGFADKELSVSIIARGSTSSITIKIVSTGVVVFTRSYTNTPKVVNNIRFAVFMDRLNTTLAISDFLFQPLTTFTLEDPTETVINSQVSTDGLYSHTEPNMVESDTGEWVLRAEQNGETITSPIQVLVSSGSNIYSAGLTEIPQGDPKIFVGPDGMDIQFVGGLPIMDDGLENIVTISLGTKNGFALNKIASNSAEAVGSSFIEESLKSITVEQIRILEDAAEKSLAWAVSDGLISKATASVSAGERGYELEIVITPPTGENRILVYTKNGENWINQKNK